MVTDGRSDAAMGEPPAQQALDAITVSVPAVAAEALIGVLTDLAPAGFAEAQGLPEDRWGATLYAPSAAAGQVAASLGLAAATALAALGVDAEPQISRAPVPGDWRDRWQAWHEPVIIGSLWIGAPWHLPAPQGKKSVVVEPSQGFGTGAHPTTRMVIGMLARLPDASTLIDIGTGSGVVAIAARRLGHRVEWACDIDPAAVDSARANAERNGMRLRVVVANALQHKVAIPPADVAVANMTLAPLVELIPRLDHPTLILSGLLKSQSRTIADILDEHGYVVVEERGRDGWICVHARLRDPHGQRGRRSVPGL